jgi:hypothetical protein
MHNRMTKGDPTGLDGSMALVVIKTVGSLREDMVNQALRPRTIQEKGQVARTQALASEARATDR